MSEMQKHALSDNKTKNTGTHTHITTNNKNTKEMEEIQPATPQSGKPQQKHDRKLVFFYHLHRL